MNIIAPFFTGPKPFHGVKPCESSLNNPPMPTQSLARLNTPPSDAGHDVTFSKVAASTVGVVPLVTMGFHGTSARSASPATHRRNLINEGREFLEVRDVGCR